MYFYMHFSVHICVYKYIHICVEKHTYIGDYLLVLPEIESYYSNYSKKLKLERLSWVIYT